uniref:4-nitrophenylphosphatase n=1 Tax=Arundo donax TaxID=35708 RepID=A0A0A9ED53_ARUDO
MRKRSSPHPSQQPRTCSPSTSPRTRRFMSLERKGF